MQPSSHTASKNTPSHQWWLQEYNGSQDWHTNDIPFETFNSLTAVAPDAGQYTAPRNLYANPSIAQGPPSYRQELSNAWSSPPPLGSSGSAQPVPSPRLNFQYVQGVKGAHSRRIPVAAPSEFSSGTPDVLPVEHIYTSQAQDLSSHVHPLQEAARILPQPKARVHPHSPYRSSRLNPNAFKPSYAPPLRLPTARRSVHMHHNPQPTLPEVSHFRVPLGTLTSTLTSNSKSAYTTPLETQLTSLRRPPVLPSSGQNTVTVPSIPNALIPLSESHAHRQQHAAKMDSENVDPYKQEDISMPMKIEAPVPVRYHNIAVQSLKTRAASMNKDVGFLSLLNGSIGQDSENDEDSPVALDEESTPSWEAQSTVGSFYCFGLANDSRMNQTPLPHVNGSMEGAKGFTYAAGPFTEQERVTSQNLHNPIPEDANATLKARLQTYGTLRLASPDTLIALTEPFLLDWCFDQSQYDRLASMCNKA
ncbi:hypothetical protein PQX77_013916 [Marasmius sp. AFHP31]|nr:hypothetical protein PQX77_013916 [Marasmius sp. AFHP31]